MSRPGREPSRVYAGVTAAVVVAGTLLRLPVVVNLFTLAALCAAVFVLRTLGHRPPPAPPEPEPGPVPGLESPAAVVAGGAVTIEEGNPR